MSAEGVLGQGSIDFVTTIQGLLPVCATLLAVIALSD
jgi:hypothetical protein